MNEFQQINGLWFTHSKKLPEVYTQMKGLAKRYARMGLLGPEYFYSDLCCSDATFIAEIWPHLGGGCEYDGIKEELLQKLMQGSGISKMPLIHHRDREIIVIDKTNQVYYSSHSYACILYFD